MATIEIRKTIPVTSDFYGTLTSNVIDDDITIWIDGDVADVTIRLLGTQSISGDVSKSLIKWSRPVTSSEQNSSPSDKGKNYLLDLKRIEESIRIKAFIEDGPTYLAWTKLWILRAMLTSAQVNNEASTLKSLKIDNITFDSSTVPVAFEKMTWKYEEDHNPSEEISGPTGTRITDAARVEVGLDFYLGSDKAS